MIGFKDQALAPAGVRRSLGLWGHEYSFPRPREVQTVAGQVERGLDHSESLTPYAFPGSGAQGKGMCVCARACVL